VDVEVDPQQDQRPEDRRENAGHDRFERVDVIPVVMGRRDDSAGDEIDG
jgi:hypothetical protein